MYRINMDDRLMEIYTTKCLYKSNVATVYYLQDTCNPSRYYSFLSI